MRPLASRYQTECVDILLLSPFSDGISFFFNETAATEIYTLSLHDALPITVRHVLAHQSGLYHIRQMIDRAERMLDRKSTRLNSSHANISYAVFCLKKK